MGTYDFQLEFYCLCLGFFIVKYKFELSFNCVLFCLVCIFMIESKNVSLSQAHFLCSLASSLMKASEYTHGVVSVCTDLLSFTGNTNHVSHEELKIPLQLTNNSTASRMLWKQISMLLSCTFVRLCYASPNLSNQIFTAPWDIGDKNNATILPRICLAGYTILKIHLWKYGGFWGEPSMTLSDLWRNQEWLEKRKSEFSKA